jgi:hypothetical protein
MGNFRYLPEEDILSLYDAAISADLTTQQEALLAGLSPHYVASLPSQGRSNARLLQTLHELNSVAELSDGTIPLVSWLRNAQMLTAIQAEGRVFEAALLKVKELVERRKSAKASTLPMTTGGPMPGGGRAPARSTGMARPLRVFISYAQADEAYRKRLEVHLAPLKREGLIAPWHNRMIDPGAESAADIDQNLTTAEIVLLLVSPDFIASEDCFEKELKLALDRHEQGTARVIPILIRPTDFSRMPFAKLEPLPRADKPVSTWRNADEAWLEVAKGIRRVVQTIGVNVASRP